VRVVTTPRVPIFARLPAIHRIRDAEQAPPDQLRAFAGLFERALGEVHADIEALYHDLFVDTCADWAIPYLADLLGSSHLTGDPWTLRAELADTIALRRRKGTRGAIERLAHDLTGWAVHAVELRDSLVWAQHLNHLRPDAGGAPPEPPPDRFVVPRGGTAPIRDPAMLSLVGTPHDPFARTPDVRPPAGGAVRYNLPNVAIYTWRLQTFRIPPIRPRVWDLEPPAPGAAWIARFDVHPLGAPVVLFNRKAFAPDATPWRLGELDGMPGPIHPARLTSTSRAGNPAAYVTLDLHPPGSRHLAATALSLHLPNDAFPPAPDLGWSFRGARLCEWEDGLVAPLAPYEIAIDPEIGRIAIGAPTEAVAQDLLANLWISYHEGAVGPIGARPGERPTEAAAIIRVPDMVGSLAAALATTALSDTPLVVELADSATHELDLATVPGHIDEGGPTLVVGRTVVIRAADGQRPIVRLVRPLAFRAATPAVAGAARVRLEGLHVTAHPGLDAALPLVRRAAIASLELVETTLDPGGAVDRHGLHRAPMRTAIRVAEPYGFGTIEDEDAFDQIPELHVRRSITGAILADRGYRLFVTDSIVDAGSGPDEDAATAGVAIGPATGPATTAWGPATDLDGVTIFGRVRTERIAGQGGLFAQPVEALDDQHGCLHWCWFPATGNRLPQRRACLSGATARLVFTSEVFGRPAYGQLAAATDARVLDRGPRDDAMGATGFLWHAHKTRNFHIRCREFMPVGTRAVLVPVT
jgi:hypothetical protein